MSPSYTVTCWYYYSNYRSQALNPNFCEKNSILDKIARKTQISGEQIFLTPGNVSLYITITQKSLFLLVVMQIIGVVYVIIIITSILQVLYVILLFCNQLQPLLITFNIENMWNSMR